jgi:hypothetical protein
MSIIFNPAGPLKYAGLFQINEATFWDKTRPPVINPQDDDELYLVKNNDRLDLIAAKKLNDPARGWVILRRNNLSLIPNDLVPGSYIYIPTITSLQENNII